jgi:hypothetical protein
MVAGVLAIAAEAGLQVKPVRYSTNRSGVYRLWHEPRSQKPARLLRCPWEFRDIECRSPWSNETQRPIS